MSRSGQRFVILGGDEHPCSYLPGRQARQPLRLPVGGFVSPEAFDRFLAEGDRRAGPALYRPECAACQACEALRVPVSRFAPSRSQRRVLQRGEADIAVEMGPALVSEERVRLFNRHKLERGLSGDDPVDAETYRWHFIRSCVDTREVRYLVGGRLVAVSLLDVGARAASSVYHYFDPDESRRSLGVFSVLKEIALCAQMGLDWYYLGLYVEGCRSLEYKADYFPHERLAGGKWRAFERRPSGLAGG